MKQENMSNIQNVILDLDETLIYAVPTKEYDHKKNRTKAMQFNFHDMDGYYIVFERPHLQEFLDYLFSNFNVSIWTAASKDYALFIIDKIVLPENKPDRRLDWIFFSYHGDLAKKIKKGSKNLNMLWDVYNLEGYNRNNTLIIDDNYDVRNTQRPLCVRVPEWEFTHKQSSEDVTLPRLKSELINICSSGYCSTKEITDKLKPQYSSA